MEKLTRTFSISVVLLLIIFGAVSTASALQYGYGYAELNLDSFKATASSPVATQNCGIYSANYNLDQNEFSATDYFNFVLNDWAFALNTSNGFADANTSDGISSSTAIAYAGDGYGPVSGAIASTYVSAIGFYVPVGGEITLSIDYYLKDTISGDEPGYSAAGSGALLGIYQNGYAQSEGQWLELAGGFGADFDEISSTLQITLSGLEANSWFTVFAGTAAYAFASASGSGSNTAPVPEPATLLLLGTGLIGIASFGKNKFKKQE